MDKKFQITPEMISALMAKVGVSQSPDAIQEQPASATKMQTVGKSLGGLLKAAAPTLASFIPGVGPIASQLLSTLNDDEWYEGFKAGGASFNDLLVTEVRKGVTGTGMPGTANPVIVKPRAAIAVYGCRINENAAVWSEVMPQMLAYVRSKTNNVLIDQVSNYTDAAKAAAKLYAAYYTVSKYLLLAEKQPLNIPNIIGPMSIVSPANLNQLMGIRDGLKAYLQSTIKLPFAFTEMLRWRFGTMFLSANTGQPALVTYDVYTGAKIIGTNGTNYSPSDVTDFIDAQKTVLIGLGRAAADLKLAFDNHQIRWDVDEKHYDEKEYVLRTNQTVVGEPRWDSTDVSTLVMDSRLNNGPTSQASVLSTLGTVGAGGNYEVGTSDLAPIQVDFCNIWHFVVYDPALSGMSAELNLANSILGSITTDTTETPHWREIAIDTLNAVDAKQIIAVGQDGSGNAVDCWYAGEAYKGPGQSTRNASLAAHFANHLRAALQTSIRIADAGKYIPVYLKNTLAVPLTGFAPGEAVFGVISMDQITYDRAIISAEQIRTLQRTALRNLFRGDYNAKQNTTEVVSEIKQATSEVVKALV